MDTFSILEVLFSIVVTLNDSMINLKKFHMKPAILYCQLNIFLLEEKSLMPGNVPVLKYVFSKTAEITHSV